MKDSNDYKCDFDCPALPGGGFIPVCCQNCKDSRKNFVTDANKQLWTDNRGFHSPKGCRLSREDMPQECRIYDCRRHTFKVTRMWAGEWKAFHAIENNS